MYKYGSHYQPYIDLQSIAGLFPTNHYPYLHLEEMRHFESKYCAQEHNAMIPPRDQNRTA